MIGICFAEVLDTEIVDGEREGGTTSLVAPKTGGVADGIVSVGSEVCLELVIREDGGLLESVHALADFDVDVSFRIEMGIGQVILVNDLLGDVTAMDAHVLVYEHVGDKKKVLEIACAIPGTKMGVGNHAVEVEFEVDETDGGGADVLVSVEAITADSHAETVYFGFAGAHGADEIGVCDLAASRDFVGQDEDHGVVAGNLFTDGAGFADTLSAAAPFVGEGACPYGGVGASKKRVNVFDFAGLGVVHFASDGWVVLDGLREQGALMGAGIESETSRQSGTGAFAEKRNGRGQDFGCGWRGRSLGLHPRKWYGDYVRGEVGDEIGLGDGHPRRWYWGRDRREYNIGGWGCWWLDGTSENISDFGVGVEDGGSESERIGRGRVVRKVTGQQVEHVFSGLFEVDVAGHRGEDNFFGEEIDLENITFMHGVGEVAFPASVVF